MSQVSKHFMQPAIEKKVYEVFINSFKNIKSSEAVISFLSDILSPTERIMLAKRISIAFLLLEGKYTYEDISKILKVTTGTIAKVHSVFALQGSGYKEILGNLLLKKAIRNSLSEFTDLLSPLPPKGVNIGEWKKSKRKSRLEREEPL